MKRTSRTRSIKDARVADCKTVGDAKAIVEEYFNAIGRKINFFSCGRAEAHGTSFATGDECTDVRISVKFATSRVTTTISNSSIF